MDRELKVIVIVMIEGMVGCLIRRIIGLFLI